MSELVIILGMLLAVLIRLAFILVPLWVVYKIVKCLVNGTRRKN